MYIQLYFRCRIGKFPFTYLGLPLQPQGLKSQDWDYLVEKLNKRLQGWKENMLSIGGRSTLINSVLSSIPLYTLSIYRVHVGVINKIDKIRRRFLWQGTTIGRKKYSLVNWYKVCLSKEYGGLGILDFRQMNTALLHK